MSAVLSDLMEGLAAALQAVPLPRGNLRTQTEMENIVSVPCAVVGLPSSVEYDATFGRGADRYTFTVRVLAGRGSDRASQVLLGQFVSSGGDLSIRTAIEADLTLGGVADSVSVTTASGLGTYVYGEAEYLGVEFTVDVIA